ncbi:unnamed protein product [Arabis nemorensis]|uniref:Uncharacterized protein n=1 Tax=Arabis nemorensis TaxID=586526 RepID=A0A565AT15_9BRAS|nr:unnamed protein product [Arabis nemorensis]
MSRNKGQFTSSEMTDGAYNSGTDQDSAQDDGVPIVALVPNVHECCIVALRDPGLSTMPVDFFGLTGIRNSSIPWDSDVVYIIGFEAAIFRPMSFGPGPQVDIRVNEVLFAYYFKTHDIDRTRCVIHKRNGPFPHLLLDVPKRRRFQAPVIQRRLDWSVESGTMAVSGATISNTLEKFRRARETILKKQCSGGVSTTSDLSFVIDDLNESHFSRDHESFRELGFTAVLDDVQSLSFKAMSACYYEKIRFREAETEMKRLCEDNIKIKKEFESQNTLLNSTIAAKNQEVSSWMGKVDVLKGEVASLEANNEESKRIVTCLEQQPELATSGATIINTWKMTQEFQDGKAPNWKAEEAETAYREVLTAQATI